MATGTKNGRIVHYVYRGGKPNELVSECGKDMETPNASYSTSREKATCKKCLKMSHNLPDVGGDPQMKVRRYDVQLEIDCNRGVIYCHDKNTDISILRICGVPMPAMRGLAGTPVEFIPQLDISLRENLPAIAGVANLALARKEPEIDKAYAKRQAAKKAKEEAANKKAKPHTMNGKAKTQPPKKKGPAVCFRIYVNGEFVEYSDEPNQRAAIRVYRKQHGLSAKSGVDVRARMAIRR